MVGQSTKLIPSLLVYMNNTVWSETSDNWHEDSTDYIWHAAPLNDWDANVTLPDRWVPPEWPDFPSSSTVLTPQERRQAEYRQIENFKP